MTYPTIKMKITPAPKLRGKMDVRFPANVEATAPILLDSSGGTYTFSFDADALSDGLSGFQTNDQARLAALGDVPWIDPIVLSLTGRSTPTENANLIARAIKDVVFLNGDAAEHYFIGTFCNGDATFGNLLTIVKASDGTIASQTTPHEVDRSGGITILEFGSAPRVKMAINYSQFPSTGVLLNDALSPLFIRKPPAEYVSKFFLNALDKFKASARNPMRGEYITIIGDSELWGAGATGESTHVPNTGALTDARNNFDAPSVANRLTKWIAQEFCNGEGYSASDPLSAAYAAGTREYRKTIDVDVCTDEQFVVISTSTGLPVAKTTTTEAGARLGKTLDLQPGQELHFRHIGDWWKLVFTTQGVVSDSSLRPVVTLHGVLNAGSANSVTTYEASPTNDNTQNFYVTWDDWRVKIVNPSGGGVMRVECIENHRAIIVANNALYGTWSGQFIPGTTNFDTGVSSKTTTLISGLGKNDRILASVGSTTGPDNPCRTRDNTKEIILGVWDDKPLADVILTSGSKTFGLKEITGDPATYGYSMSEVAGALNNVANELDIAFVDYYAVSAANDVPVFAGAGTTVNASKSVGGLSTTSNLRDGMAVRGAGIPDGTTLRVTGSSTIELSLAATASATVDLSFHPSRSADGIHANDAGHNDWYQAFVRRLGVDGGSYNVLGSNLAPIENPIVRGSLTVTKTVAGSLSSDFTVETVNATSGETHSSTFRSQDNNAGTVRSLFTAAGPLNAGNKTQGNFDLLVEDGTIFMSRTTSQVASGGTSMTLHDRVGSGAAKITLSTFGDSAFAGGGLNVSGGAIKSSHATAGVGYATGAGGAVTQATSKSTGVTLNRATGKITMNNAALNAGASVSFTLTDSAIAATDGIGVQIVSGATAGAYSVTVDAVASGSCQISLRNLTGGNLSEAVVLRFWKINSIDS